MRKMISVICLATLLLISLPFQSALAAETSTNSKPKVIPSLQEWTGDTGTFTLGSQSRIVIPPSSDLARTASVFKEDLKAITGRDVAIVQANSPVPGDFFLTLDQQTDTSIGEEGYHFEVGDVVNIHANTITGVFYGTRTALQILQQDTTKASIVKGKAKDYPKYKDRGFMLDVGRKFFTMDFLKDYVKFMSYYKMNDFQLHLSDNEFATGDRQGQWNKYSAFRLESTKYPELTAKDGHYTKLEFRELQDLAKDRGLTITPEIDTPSHALAFTKVRPDLVKDNLPLDHLDITRPEAVEFVKDVWSEYLDGNWFDAKEIHIGADEFDRNDKSTVEAYRQYLNTLNSLFKSKGKTARMWGSLSFFPGTTPVDSDITMNGWNNGWQNPIDAVNAGHKMINTTDGLLYIVPKAGYYYDYLNTKWLYENWEPTYFSSTLKLSADNPKLLGGMFAVWNDLLGEKVSAPDVHDRVKDALPTLAEKMWRGQSSDTTYTQFRQISSVIGEAPNTNLLRRVTTQSETVLSYPFDEGSGLTAGDTSGNAYNGALSGVKWTNGKTGKAVVFSNPNDHISSGLTTKGFPWTVSAWVNMTDNSQPEAILLESADGAIKLKQKETGKAGFSREGFDYSFNSAIPTGRWVHVALKGDLKGTSLYIDGELVDKLPDTTMLPAAVVGSATQAFKGALDDLRIVDRVLSDKEIAVAAGSPPSMINIAARQPAVASSTEVDYLSANLAFDEDESKTSRWSSNYNDNEWIYVDLGKNCDINKVILKWEAAYAKGYKIQVSNDAQTWKDVYTTSTGVGGTEVIKFPTENVRYVKMQGIQRVGSYGYSLFEFEVYQPSTTVTVPVTGIQLDKMSLALKAGETAQLVATVLPNNATNKNVSWSSSDETVAKVATIGGEIIVTALTAGTAKIKVTTTEGAFAAESTVTVEALSSPGVRVLTYNIHHGAGNDNIVNLPRIADVIKRLNPDIVALQEVDKNVSRSGNVDQAAKLAELTGMHVIFGKAIDLSGGEYGVALLSRYPITSSEKTFLPNSSGAEQRVVLTAKIAPTNGLPEFTFSGTHLEWSSKSIQANQVNKIIELYGSTSPYILAGDFNATPESDTIKSLTSKWTDATAGIADWTNEEGGKIDYVMYGNNNQWRVVNAQAIQDDVASDHRPVLSVLEWVGSQPIEVTGVQLDKTALALKVGESSELVATVQPNEAASKNVTWSSSDETIAKVVDSGDGKAIVTALKAGSTDITVTTAEGNFTAVSKVSVEAVVSLAPGTTLSGANSVLAGSEFTIRFGLKNVALNIYGQDIKLNYDANVMEFVSAKSTKDGVSIVESKDQPGTLRLIIASQGAGNAVTGTVEFVEIVFKAKNVTQAALGTISVADATLGDDKGSETKADASLIKVQVTQIPVGIPGDVNNDGKVSIGDLGFAAANYGKTSSSPNWNQVKLADMNNDNMIDISDLAAIANKIIQ
ncbi:family 20 glycosylhydrolase [Paenibacillus sp. LMG 31458]|uniref:Beta-N-acetylhexosaminidase n=1 Tax=Paenibacillus phytorum TaxID=2654977 RepID=A0ABX1XVB0_9BACL|nr:family 20 glycosylhydrolase [Paenibacillus phytorum]NOU71738.1 family 20 glycosylhydrolase [Paenibacillus phytorum]